MMNVENRFCQVSGVKVHLRQGGQGRPILFLHGAGGVTGWNPFFVQLAQGAQVWAPDHPGFGQSDDPAWIKHMPDLAMFYLDFLDQLAPAEGFDVVGHSIGGWLAAEIAVRNSRHVRSLTLMSSAGLRVPGTPMGDIFIWNDEETARHLVFDPDLRAARLAAQPSEEEADILVRNKFSFAKLAWHPRLFNPDLQKWLHRIQVPTQVIWGDHDGLFPLAYAHHWHQQLPASALHIVPDCGHSPINEKPAETAALIHQFIAKTAA